MSKITDSDKSGVRIGKEASSDKKYLVLDVANYVEQEKDINIYWSMIWISLILFALCKYAGKFNRLILKAKVKSKG